MVLPDLSGLHVATPTKATVFEHLIENQVAKDKSCTKHRAALPDPDKDAAAYDQAVSGNCALDGYLMYKAVPSTTLQVPPADLYLGRPMVVALDDGTQATFSSMGKRAVSVQTRRNKFWTGEGSNWVEKVFAKVCARGKDVQGNDLGSVEWSEYKDDLVKATDWYFLDPEERGHLFLQLLDTPTFKEEMDMPTRGAFSGRYLYVALVCSTPHTIGSNLMAMAEAACRTLGCTGIALATLSNSAEFYLSKGFQFMSQDGGRPIDVSPWLYTTEVGGKTRTKLDLSKDVPPATRKRWRPTDDEEPPDELCERGPGTQGARKTTCSMRNKRNPNKRLASPPASPPSSPTLVAKKRRLWDAYEATVDKAHGLYQQYVRLSG